MKKPLALTDNLLHLIKHAARSLLVDAHYDRQISERRNSRRTVRPLFAGPMLAICPTALSAGVCPLRLPVAWLRIRWRGSTPSVQIARSQ